MWIFIYSEQLLKTFQTIKIVLRQKSQALVQIYVFKFNQMSEKRNCLQFEVFYI